MDARISRLRRVLSLAALGTTAALLLGQDLMRSLPPPPLDENDFKISSDVELVLLDVSVKNKDGGFPSDLTKENFQVFENGKPQTITVFAKQDMPVTVGLVVDNSGSVGPKRPELVTAALTFVSRSNPKDEMFLVNFNDAVWMGLPEGTPFTDDSRVLREALLNMQPRGRTALYDAIAMGLDHLEKGRCDKKTLVVVSDGGDNSSERDLNAVIRRAQGSIATVYTVGIFTPDDKEKNPAVLRRLANLTGGEVFLTNGKKGIVEACDKIAKDIRNRYTIGYVPDMANYDGKPRKIRVLASTPDERKLFVRTRTEYIADYKQPEATAAKGSKGR